MVARAWPAARVDVRRLGAGRRHLAHRRALLRRAGDRLSQRRRRLPLPAARLRARRSRSCSAGRAFRSSPPGPSRCSRSSSATTCSRCCRWARRAWGSAVYALAAVVVLWWVNSRGIRGGRLDAELAHGARGRRAAADRRGGIVAGLGQRRRRLRAVAQAATASLGPASFGLAMVFVLLPTAAGTRPPTSAPSSRTADATWCARWCCRSSSSRCSTCW